MSANWPPPSSCSSVLVLALGHPEFISKSGSFLFRMSSPKSTRLQFECPQSLQPPYPGLWCRWGALTVVSLSCTQSGSHLHAIGAESHTVARPGQCRGLLPLVPSRPTRPTPPHLCLRSSLLPFCLLSPLQPQDFTPFTMFFSAPQAGSGACC